MLDIKLNLKFSVLGLRDRSKIFATFMPILPPCVLFLSMHIVANLILTPKTKIIEFKVVFTSRWLS